MLQNWRKLLCWFLFQQPRLIAPVMASVTEFSKLAAQFALQWRLALEVKKKSIFEIK